MIGYVVTMRDGTQTVQGTYAVEALYRLEAKELGVQLARADVDREASLVVMQVDVRCVSE